MELTIRPEVIGGYYSVEWRYLEFDRDASDWKPLEALPREDDRDNCIDGAATTANNQYGETHSSEWIGGIRSAKGTD